MNTIILLIQSILALLEKLLPLIDEAARKGEVTAAQQAQVRASFESLKNKAAGEFSGAHWQVETPAPSTGLIEHPVFHVGNIYRSRDGDIHRVIYILDSGFRPVTTELLAGDTVTRAFTLQGHVYFAEPGKLQITHQDDLIEDITNIYHP